jgi:hypothetical protein
MMLTRVVLVLPLEADWLRRLESLLARPIQQVRRASSGYTPALRLVVLLADGRSVFAKIGTTADTAAWLRAEHRLYQALSGSFMAKLIAWADDGQQPILVLEDLSHAYWPPPWSNAQIRSVLDTLHEISAQRVPGLPFLRDAAHLLDGWQRVAADPQPFLSLGFVTERWWDQVLPILLPIDGAHVVDGAALLHNDVRSDNICFVNGRTVLVDWNLARIGHPNWDIAAWLPSLTAEGGPPPEHILPGAAEFAAIICGYFASRAGLPSIPDAPRVRHIQRVQLRAALPWMVRAMRLPPLNGDWPSVYP